MVRAQQNQKRLRRGGKNKEENYKKGLNDPNNHHGMVTQLQPATYSVKSSGPQEALL